MNIEKMREEFEVWANTHYLLSELNWSFVDGEYEEPEIQYAWESWQASRESLVIELPNPWQTNVGAMMTPNGVKFAIESEGLKFKVKP